MARYVALGDSLTEGLCDDSRMPAGEYRGWADRLALLLALASPAGGPVAYANLAVRSRKVPMPSTAAAARDRAARRPRVVLIGANDLVGRRAECRWARRAAR